MFPLRTARHILFLIDCRNSLFYQCYSLLCFFVFLQLSFKVVFPRDLMDVNIKTEEFTDVGEPEAKKQKVNHFNIEKVDFFAIR